MGGNQSHLQYSVAIQDASQVKGETPAYRHPQYPDKLLEHPKIGCKTMQDVLLFAAKEFANSPLLGTKNLQTNQYVWKSYSECLKIATALGINIMKNDLTQSSDHTEDINGNQIKMEMIGVFSKNREEWLLLEYANFLYNFTLVPLYDTLGLDSLSFVLEQTQLKTVVCSKESVTNLMKCTKLVNLKNIVLMDDIDDILLQKIVEKGIKVLYFHDLTVQKDKTKENFNYKTVKPHDIFTFSYTSGTTGNPKGALISHRNMVGVIANAEAETDLGFGSKDVYISYLPLPHVLERLFICVMLYSGARIGFYSGDVLKLKDDLILLRPTVFVSVPRLYSKFYDTIKKNIDSLTGIKGYLARTALNSKLSSNLQDNSTQHQLYDKLIFSATKQALGGRVRMAATGGAPISGDILKYLKVTLCCPIQEGYGQTESTGATFMTSQKDPETGHVGGIGRQMEYKLVDIPEMSYLSTDIDENGNPAPRGEICFRGVCVFAGYYKDIEKTKEAVDKDGWLHSGDVGVINPKTGALKIIDRKKNLFKLAQGEYIAPEKIENIYLTNKFVDEVWIHGDSLQSIVITICVPNKANLQVLATNMNIQGSFEDLCQNEQIKKAVLAELEKTGKEAKLLSFEQAKKIHLEPVSFALKDILTTTFKIKRKEARDIYKNIIDELYK